MMDDSCLVVSIVMVKAESASAHVDFFYVIDQSEIGHMITANERGAGLVI